jgi:hypothetical protein
MSEETMGTFAGVNEAEIEILTPYCFGSESTVEFGRSWFKRQMSHVSHFVTNTCKAAGREIGKAGHAIQNFEGMVTRNIGKIPIVGAPLKAVYDFQYHLTIGPLVTASQIAAGRNVKRAMLDHLKDLGHDVKNVAPIAQSIVSLVPGIGSGISAALGAGLALAEGQPLDKIAEAAVSGAIPGGPVAVAAYHVASNGVKAAVTGKKFDFVDAAKEGLGGALQTLGLPPAATQSIAAGVDAAGKIAHGEPLDKTLTSAAVSALPIPAQAKSALHEATDLSIDLAHGKPVDKALLARVHSVAGMLPIDADTRKQIQDAVKAGKSLAPDQPLGKSLGIALHAAIADSLIGHATKGAPKPVIDALKTGLATGTAVVHQSHNANQLKQVQNKLIENGILASKAVPALGEARKLAAGGTRGFDHALGLVSHSITPFDLLHARDQHKGADRLGFDLALSVKNGLVVHPIPTNLSPAAVAGHAIVHGSAGISPDNQKTIAAVVSAHPSASVGAKVAAANIQAHHENWIARFFHAIGFN